MKIPAAQADGIIIVSNELLATLDVSGFAELLEDINRKHQNPSKKTWTLFANKYCAEISDWTSLETVRIFRALTIMSMANRGRLVNNDVLQATSQKIKPHLKQLDAQSLKDVIRSFDRARCLPSPDFLDTFFNAATEKLDASEEGLQCENAIKILTSFSKLGCPIPQNLGAAIRRQIQLNEQTLKSADYILYYAAVQHILSGDEQYKDAARIFADRKEVFDDCKTLTFNGEAKTKKTRRLKMACMWFDFECDLEMPPEDHRTSLEEGRLIEIFRDAQQTIFPKGYKIDSLNHHVDLFMPARKRNIAIQFDGNPHFIRTLRNEGDTKNSVALHYNGATLFMTALTHKFDTDVRMLRIPYRVLVEAQKEDPIALNQMVRFVIAETKGRDPGHYVAHGRYQKPESVSVIPLMVQGQQKINPEILNFDFG